MAKAKKKRYILIADDVQVRHDIIKDVVMVHFKVNPDVIRHTYGYSDTIAFLDEFHHEIKHIFLDHDFDLKFHFPGNTQDKEKTGSDVASYMVFNGYDIPTTIVSINPVGAENIRSILVDGGIEARKVPYNYILDMWEGKIQ